MDDFVIETMNYMADCVNNYLDTANMELDVSPQNGMPPVPSQDVVGRYLGNSIRKTAKGRCRMSTTTIACAPVLFTGYLQ